MKGSKADTAHTARQRRASPRRTGRDRRDTDPQLVDLIENPLVSVYRTSLAGAFLYANETLARLLGYASAEALMRESVQSCYMHREERERLLGLLRAAGKVNNFEAELRKRSGEPISVLMNATLAGETISGIIIDITARKLAETSLLEEKNKFEAIIAAMGDGVIIQDVNHRVLYQNDVHRGLVGDHVGEYCYEGYQNRSSECDDCPVALSFRDGRVHMTERPVTPGGVTRHLEVTSSPLRDAAGNIVAGIEIVRDVTERKKADDNVRQSWKRLQLLVDRMPVACIMWTPDRRVDLWNPMAERIFGFSAPEALGRHAYDLIMRKEVRPLVDDVWQRALSGDRDAQSENENVTRDGRTIVCEWHNTPIRDAEGRVSGVLSMVQDITERKRAETDLRGSEEKYRTIFNSAPVALWEEDFSGVKAALDALRSQGITDLKRYLEEHPDFSWKAARLVKIVDVNDTTLRLYGARTRSELFGALPEVLTPNAQNVLKDIIIAIDEGKTHFEAEVMNRTIDGKIIDALMTVMIPSETSTFRNLIVSIMDITAYKRAEEERKKLEAQLQQSQKMEAIGLLAGGVAHDFNNILSAIIGYASILQMKISPDDPLRPNVEQVLAASHRAAGLTQGLLAFSRKQIINPKLIQVNDSIRKTERLLRRIIGEDIDLLARYAPEDRAILMDAGQLEQIIINLATNARDAMPGGGTLRIETATAAMDDEFIRRHGFGRTGDYAVIAVSDTGTGMDEQTRMRIFEPFFTTKEVGKGTGLGLSTVYGIVKQHSGFIACDSNPGAGTAFHVYFPLVAANPEPGLIEPPPPVRGGSETILVAEDDEVMRGLFRTVFTDRGYRVITAKDGEDAVRKFREHAGEIQLLVIDVIMPKKNGKEVYEAVRAIDPGIKVLFTSGYTDDIVHKQGILDEGIQFITKPSEPSAILRKVRDILDGP